MIRASIVVLSYNGFNETTGPCLESLVANTSGDYELIVIDNASTDGTQDALKTFAKQHNHVRIQLNDANKGFAGGNNDGIKLARGKYIILLNNDTLVPTGWLDQLLQRFDDHPEIGLIGPVTNSSGNEQRIELDGLNESNYEKISGDYIELQKGVWFSTEKLGFFCVAIRKDVIEKIGLLDEGFGIGMFEDDDYCLRAKKAAYTLAVVEDCFVYHKGSFSFLKLSVENYRALFEINRSYFRAKHGFEWTFSDLALSYLKLIDRKVSILKAQSGAICPSLESIAVRLDNFQHLLVQVHQAEVGQGTREKAVCKTGPQARNAFWKSRWKQFHNSFIHGNYNGRRHYIRLLLRWLLQQIKNPRKIPEGDRVIAELSSIRNVARDRKVIIFPATIDFHYMPQRPQQLARAFAENGYLVIYGTLNHQSDRVGISEKVAENLYLVHESHFSLLKHVFKPEDATFYCLWPNNIKHLDYVPHHNLVYDYMDELRLLDLPKDMVERDHMEMLRVTNLITVSADNLMEKIPESYLSKTLLINNAVSDEFINAVDCCNDIPDELIGCGNSPVIGYFGAIAEWFDFELVGLLAETLPATHIVLIGPTQINVGEQLESLVKNHSNIRVLPHRPQIELVPFLKRFDVCLIPFIKNDVTDAVSPVKLFEYFSAGKPVVTTDLYECRKYPQIKCTTSRAEFIEATKNLLDNQPSNRQREDLKLLAKKNTWRHRVNKIIDCMSDKRMTPNCMV